MATSKSYQEQLLEELRELVLDSEKNVRWDAIREEYFECIGGTSWYPRRVWCGEEECRVWDILLK